LLLHQKNPLCLLVMPYVCVLHIIYPRILLPCLGRVLTHSFIPLARAECNDSLLFSGASSVPLCYIPFPSTPFPPTSIPSSITSSCHPFLGLPLSLLVYKFIYNTFLGILFSSILCTCSNQHIIFNVVQKLLSADHSLVVPSRSVFLNRQATARYRALASIIWAARGLRKLQYATRFH
jgi:type IV secretory pathway VirB3-like protein